MFGFFKKKREEAKGQNKSLARQQTNVQDDKAMNSKRNIRDRVGAKERRLYARRQQHDRRQMIRFEFKDDRRSGQDRRRENNKAWSKNDIVD